MFDFFNAILFRIFNNNIFNTIYINTRICFGKCHFSGFYFVLKILTQAKIYVRVLIFFLQFFVAMSLSGIVTCTEQPNGEMLFHISEENSNALETHTAYIQMLSSMGVVVPKVSNAFQTGSRVDYNGMWFTTSSTVRPVT